MKKEKNTPLSNNIGHVRKYAAVEQHRPRAKTNRPLKYSTPTVYYILTDGLLSYAIPLRPTTAAVNGDNTLTLGKFPFHRRFA